MSVIGALQCEDADERRAGCRTHFGLLTAGAGAAAGAAVADAG
jgi:hypothetical protein